MAPEFYKFKTPKNMTLSAGPLPAEIMFIGDAPTFEEISKGEAFSSYAIGRTLSPALRELNTIKNACFFTYLFPRRLTEEEEPKKFLAERKTSPGPGWVWENGFWLNPEIQGYRDKLLAMVQEVNPKIIICCGPLTLWALAGVKELSKWRGSRLQPPKLHCTVIPVLPLDSPQTQPESLNIILMDFRRARKIYEGAQIPRDYKFSIKPTFSQVLFHLNSLHSQAEKGQMLLSGDLETRLGHIACFGLAWSETEALCIPFLHVGQENPSYWSAEEEAWLIWRLQSLFRHPNITWTGQNYLYDCQYFHRHWGFLPINVFDTMIGHHAIYSNMRKGLDFLSSLYAHDHVYWKDEIKEWDPAFGESQYWTYNCKDACITWEITREIKEAQKEAANPNHCEFQQAQFFPVLRMMLRGVRINHGLKATLSKELTTLAFERQEQLDYIAGHPLNPKSPKQLSQFFYTDLGIPGVKNLSTDSLTTNSPAMALIAEREPALKPLCQLIVELRSLGIFKSTFIDAQLDTDDRMRCSFGIAATTTNRYNSRENAFGTGMNMMNIPSSEKQKIKSETYIKLPNIRKLFIPDHGFTFFDMDLDRADLQVVVWEAEDKELKIALRQGIDTHCLNACAIFDIKGIPPDELTETHPNYKNHRASIGEAKRNKSKAGVHATNYGVGDRTLAIALGITVHEASQFRKKWLSAHPGILRWHTRTTDEVQKRGYIENRFGARFYKLGRFDLPEFLGWLPQSTVAGVINRALLNIDTEAEAGLTPVQLLLQVHDSLAGQFPSNQRDKAISDLQRLSKIVIPYPDPLIIPTSVNCSIESWGDCK